MAASKGNQYWKMAEPECLGRPRIFPTPSDLWKSVEPYFKYVDENPIIKTSTTTTAKGQFVNEDTLQRPYTWEGLYIFLGVGNLDHYKTKEEFSGILTYIGNLIRNQKFEGATAGIFNANIIARDLGLKDNSDITSNGKQINITPIEFTTNNSDKQ